MLNEVVEGVSPSFSMSSGQRELSFPEKTVLQYRAFLQDQEPHILRVEDVRIVQVYL